MKRRTGRVLTIGKPGRRKSAARLFLTERPSEDMQLWGRHEIHAPYGDPQFDAYPRASNGWARHASLGAMNIPQPSFFVDTLKGAACVSATSVDVENIICTRAAVCQRQEPEAP